MTGWPKGLSAQAMTKEAFLSWMERLTPSEREIALRNYRPRVRVPVERQVPNEADL